MKIKESSLAVFTVLMLHVVVCNGQTIPLIASGTFTFVADTVSGFDYTITLFNDSQIEGGPSINAFWYGWTFAGDLLPFAPMTPAGPTGWTAQDFPFTGTPASIIFLNASGNAIPPGGLAAFTFKAPAADTPAVLNGSTLGPPSGPVGGSFAFSGNTVLSGLQSGFVVTEVPEPSVFSLFALSRIGWAILGFRKKSIAPVELKAHDGSGLPWNKPLFRTSHIL